VFVERIRSDGLAHSSYLVGDGDSAAVIDPRRDCEIYIRKARERDCRITHVFETHRNEDLVSGAPLLAEATGARVLHGPNAAGEVAYAETVREGGTFSFGDLRLEVLETPGHTDDSLSFVLRDESFGGEPVGVFTGDALFVGDVGRTDFYPDRAEEVAGLLFDSLQKILALGDQAIIWPAHGAGSVCGDAMADREFSTVGYERTNNRRLVIHDRAEFVAAKVAEHHDRPPYFRRMEELNLTGGDPMPAVPPPALSPRDGIEERDGRVLVDVRGLGAFQGAHVPRSLALPVDMIAAFGGWLLGVDEEIVLVCEDAEQAAEATIRLGRIGLDDVVGFVATPLPAWAAMGHDFDRVECVGVGTVAERVDEPSADWTLLDVRGLPEVREGMVDGARHVYVGELPEALASLDRTRHYTVMCTSGARATVAASVLKRAGFERVDVFLGSMGAWRSAGRPVVEPESA
jgi:hydroxyacylglutathione hydrolase